MDCFTLEIFKMVITDFQLKDQSGKPKFFQKTFLMANTIFEMVLGMLFLNISNADISFNKGTFMWKFYIINKVLPITKHVQLIDPKDSVIAALDINSETFVIHVAIKELEEMPVYSEKQGQIEAQSKAQVGIPSFNQVLTKVLAEYFNYSNIFSAKNATELSENTRINEHAIKLEKEK